MRYRKLDASGDMMFGNGGADFYRDQPEAVAQACLTRLRLWTGDWFLDTDEGTDWMGSVLGAHTAGLYDAELRGRIAETQGVVGLEAYRSVRNGEGRALAVQATINTAFGTVTFAAPVVVNAPTVPASQALSALLGLDGEMLMGADGELLVAPNEPGLLIYV